MLRIIHTADWHIGQTLAGHSRDFEHRAVLTELAAIARAREADALIIAGDIFDHQNPSGDAQKLFYETLIALKAACPRMTIVVTAGNHDAAGRLEAPRALLHLSGIHVTGNIRRVNGMIDAARHLVPLHDAYGKLAAHVLAVSHPTAACLPPLPRLDDVSGSPVAEATRALYAELFAATQSLSAGLPLIVTGHLHVAGAIESEGAERHILVGGQHAVPPDVFPVSAAYVALGHLHKAQGIGRDTIRYSGSLLPLSATELSYRHGVTLVTLDVGKVVTDHIPVRRPVAFLRVPERGEIALDHLSAHLAALNLPADLPPHLRPFVQVWLSRDGLKSGFRTTVDALAETFPIRLVETKVAPLATETAALVRDPVQRLSDLKPDDLFRQAFEIELGREPALEHLQAFHHALAAAGG